MIKTLSCKKRCRMFELKQTEALYVSKAQMKKIHTFIAETNYPYKVTNKTVIAQQNAIILNILASFDYDPNKAAECYNKAEEKATAAFRKTMNELRAKIPETFSDEETTAFRDKAGDEAGRIYEEIFTAEFDNKLNFNSEEIMH